MAMHERFSAEQCQKQWEVVCHTSHMSEFLKTLPVTVEHKSLGEVLRLQVSCIIVHQ